MRAIQIVGAASGGGETPPWLVSGNVASYEAKLGINQAGGSLSTWDDALGRAGLLLATAVGGNNPGWTADAGDGEPILIFNATCALENNTWGAFDANADWTCMFLAKRTSTNDGVIMGYGDHADGLGRVMVRQPAGAFPSTLETGLFSSTSGAADALVPASIQAATHHIILMRKSGAQFFASVDLGVEVAQAVPAGSYSVVKFVIGIVRAAAGFALPWAGELTAATFFNVSLSASQQQGVKRYWKQEYPARVL